MFKHLIPAFHASSIFEILPESLKAQGFDLIICDLDNTLDTYLDKLPTRRVMALVESYKAAGLTVTIVSNNHEARVKKYASSLQIKYLFKAHKPLKKRTLDYIITEFPTVKKPVLIGDQLLTDVWFGYHCKLPVILTEPISPKDQLSTRFNRLFERPIRKHFKKKGLFKEFPLGKENSHETN